MNLSTHLNGFEEAVAGLNAVLALAAAVVNVHASLKVRTLWSRALFATVGALSGGYVVAYLTLLLGDVDPARWSSLMRGVSLVTWAAVWISPALKRTRDDAAIERFAASVRDEATRLRAPRRAA